MRKGEHYIVISHEGCRHPVGTEVVVIDMVDPVTNTAASGLMPKEELIPLEYEGDALAKEIDGIKV